MYMKQRHSSYVLRNLETEPKSILNGVNTMAQDPLAQDSLTNDFYLQILYVEQP